MKLTKIEMAEVLCNSAAWDGESNPEKLAKMYSYGEIKEAYEMIDEAEQEFYESEE